MIPGVVEVGIFHNITTKIFKGNGNTCEIIDIKNYKSISLEDESIMSMASSAMSVE